MFTTWDQVRDWIRDNNFAHWVFYKTNPDSRDADKANDKIVDSNAFTIDTYDGKLEMTEKYLKMYGGHVWGVGFKTANTTVGGTVCEARIESAPTQAPAGVGYNMMPAQVDEDKIAARIEAKLRAEYERREYEKLRADLDKERKAFEDQKNSAMGAFVHYMAPIGQVLAQRAGLRNVAGIDTEAPITAQPIMPTQAPNEDPENPETGEQEIFTDEEADQLFTLVARWKAVEPDYMQFLEKIVVMAETGDKNYQLAKQFI